MFHLYEQGVWAFISDGMLLVVYERWNYDLLCSLSNDMIARVLITGVAVQVGTLVGRDRSIMDVGGSGFLCAPLERETQICVR